MQKWLSGTRAVVLMVMTWALGWGLGMGGIMEIVDPHGKIEDIWPNVLAILGFLAGVVFCLIFRIAEGRRKFYESSLPRSSAWGAVAGLLVGLLVVSQLADAREEYLSLTAATITAIGTLLGALTGAVLTWFFRYAARNQSGAGAPSAV
jgi:hypothetical protein